MRSSLLTKLTLAAVATTAQAYKSQYYTDWDQTMTEIGCENGPVQCGDDGECGEGYGCLILDSVAVCEDISKWLCYKPNECKNGQVMNPLRYCECIDVAERDAMFCAPSAEEEEESEDCDSEETVEEEEVTVHEEPVEEEETVEEEEVVEEDEVAVDEEPVEEEETVEEDEDTVDEDENEEEDPIMIPEWLLAVDQNGNGKPDIFEYDIQGDEEEVEKEEGFARSKKP